MNIQFKAVLLSAALAAAAVPALAQAQGFNHNQHGPQGHAQPTASFVRPGFDLFQRINQVQSRIDHGRATGALNRREAGRMTGDLKTIRTELTRATSGRNGRLTPAMHNRFEQRINRVSGLVQVASNDRHGQHNFRR